MRAMGDYWLGLSQQEGLDDAEDDEWDGGECRATHFDGWEKRTVKRNGFWDKIVG